MAFYCPQCRTGGTLNIERVLELPADSRSDEIAVQLVACVVCGFRGAAVYEESRRGRLDSDCYEHSGLELPREEYEALRGLILACPEPRNTNCMCEAHRTLGAQNASGIWIGLERLGRVRRFPMRLA